MIAFTTGFLEELSGQLAERLPGLAASNLRAQSTKGDTITFIFGGISITMGPEDFNPSDDRAFAGGWEMEEIVRRFELALR